jgi:hypothetical protein
MLTEQQTGLPAAEACLEHGIRSATPYKYNMRFGGMGVWGPVPEGARRRERQVVESAGQGDARPGRRG